MDIQRKAYIQLLQWKNATASFKAILIKGAHYVGKSYLAEAFARKAYAGTSCSGSTGVSAADVGKTVLFCACLFLLR